MHVETDVQLLLKRKYIKNTKLKLKITNTIKYPEKSIMTNDNIIKLQRKTNGKDFTSLMVSIPIEFAERFEDVKFMKVSINEDGNLEYETVR